MMPHLIVFYDFLTVCQQWLAFWIHFSWPGTREHYLHSQNALGQGYMSNYHTLPWNAKTPAAYCEFTVLHPLPNSERFF